MTTRDWTAIVPLRRNRRPSRFVDRIADYIAHGFGLDTITWYEVSRGLIGGDRRNTPNCWIVMRCVLMDDDGHAVSLDTLEKATWCQRTEVQSDCLRLSEARQAIHRDRMAGRP